MGQPENFEAVNINKTWYGKHRTVDTYTEERRSVKHRMDGHIIDDQVQQGIKLMKRHKRRRHTMKMFANFVLQYHISGSANIKLTAIENDDIGKRKWGWGDDVFGVEIIVEASRTVWGILSPSCRLHRKRCYRTDVPSKDISTTVWNEKGHLKNGE